MDSKIVLRSSSPRRKAFLENLGLSFEISPLSISEDPIHGETYSDYLRRVTLLKLGKFDFFNCSGVLHHLENPDLGLKILSDALKEDGGGHIMVYGQYGRTGVYQVQELLRRTGKGIENRQEEVASAWEVMNSLPSTNWYSRGAELVNDHKK